jgi:ribose 1,5-bisphosphokinase
MSEIVKNKGRLFLIVGNSGSGKDTLLTEVLARWPTSVKPIRIPQRYITRPPHDSEPYISVTAGEFADLKRENKFSFAWHIYGTDYGVPAVVLKWLNSGQHVMVNVSRQIIPQALRLIPDLKVIFVKIPLAITRQRLMLRHREAENGPSFQLRLKRAKENQTLKHADLIIDNNGPLDVSVEKLLSYLLSFCN